MSPTNTGTLMQPLGRADRNSHGTYAYTATDIAGSQQVIMPALNENSSEPRVSYLPLPPPLFGASPKPIIPCYQTDHVGERSLGIPDNTENASPGRNYPTSNRETPVTEHQRTAYDAWEHGPSYQLIMNPEMTNVEGLPTDQTDTQSSGKGSAEQAGSESSSQPTKATSSRNSTENAWREKPPSIVSQLKKKFSSHKSKDHVHEPELPMDIDLDGLMSFMEEERNTRFVRREGSHSN